MMPAAWCLVPTPDEYRYAEFDRFGSAVLGVANEQSRLYGSHGEGKNGGVQLLHLEAMRNTAEYDQVLDKVASGRDGRRIGYLGDQTLYSFLSVDYPHLFYRLPCEWNRQISMHFVRDAPPPSLRLCGPPPHSLSSLALRHRASVLRRAHPYLAAHEGARASVCATRDAPDGAIVCSHSTTRGCPQCPSPHPPTPAFTPPRAPPLDHRALRMRASIRARGAAVSCTPIMARLNASPR